MARRRTPRPASAGNSNDPPASAAHGNTNGHGSQGSYRRSPSIYDLPLATATNSESKGTVDDAFDTEGNFKETLPSKMSACIDAEGNPTLVETPASSADNDVAAGAEGDNGGGSAGGFPFDRPEDLNALPPLASSASANGGTSSLRLIIPNADVTRSPEPIAESAANGDLDPGTSTEEEFLDEEAEREALAEERANKKKKEEGAMSPVAAVPATAKTPASPVVPAPLASRRNRWWAMSRVGRTKSILWVVLRWPLLLLFGLFMSIDLTCYVAVRQWVRWYEWAITWRGSRRRLRQKMMEATNYKDYKTAAAALDEFLKNKAWKQEEICPHYDVDLVHRTVRRLRRHRAVIDAAFPPRQREVKKDTNNDIDFKPSDDKNTLHSPATQRVNISARANATRDVMKILQHGACKHNFGGIENEQLYSHTYLGTKYLVEGFLDEVCKNLQRVAESPDVSEDDKHEFFKKAARNYGRTALCLSGGASLGYYHVGVVKSLFDEKLLPHIITGTSAGSLIAALICCRTDEELVEEVFVPSIHKILTACDIPYLERFKRLYRTGAMFDHREWFQKIMLATKGPLTFWEAYQRTGRVLNIPIVPDEPHSPFKLCNYITTPNVLIATAVMASSAVPGILNPVELLQKNEAGQITAFTGSGRKWRDGSLKMDIPERELHRLWNVNFTIVSQVNPHIVLFFFDRKGSAGSPTAHRYGQGWRGGFVASALVHHFKLDLQKWMSLLKDLELLPRVLGTDVSDVFLQRFEGDVTIVPRPQLQDYQNILTDPTNERMKWYIERGEARAWPKLNMIANRMRVERALAEYRRRFAEPTTPSVRSARGQSPGGGRTLAGGGGVEKTRRRSSGMSAVWGARSVSAGGPGGAEKMRWPLSLGDALEQDMEGEATITE
ncbi:hypothetical protein HDU87_002923 [Geranomyces variabilis]|uniref:PNPLA domain-containing protein n=1 Tax=Geranomyces variabilis TaxID=109894 RepID=A0AAD5TKI8_9FUNG|nr:hypothetical protein HDU87_002923 [Geranomyces variabilis]